MSLQDQLKETMPNLHSADVLDKELFVGAIDYTRPLSEYTTPDQIATFIVDNPKTHHIYTEDLNVNGIAIQDSFEKYLGHESLNSGTLKEALKTPMHLAFAIDGDKEKLEKLQKEKPYFNLGTFLHQAILEPTKFGRVIVEPKYSLSTKEGVATGIEFWEGTIEEKGGINNDEEITPQEALNLANERFVNTGLSLEKQDGKKAYLKELKSISGLEAVTEENFTKIQILKKHYESYGGGILKRLIKHSKREISLYYTDPETGLDVKVRPDALQFEENIGANAIISVKSSGIEDLRAFYYQAAKLHYDLSEGMYQEVASNVTGRDFNCTITVMLQTVAPFAVALLVWSPHDIEMGKHKYKTALRTVKECQETNQYPGYDAFSEQGAFGLIQMELPQWNNKDLLPISISA